MNIKIIKAALIVIVSAVVFQKHLNENKIYTISSKAHYYNIEEFIPLDKPLSENQYNTILASIGSIPVTNSLIQNTKISYKILSFKNIHTWLNLAMLIALIILILHTSFSKVKTQNTAITATVLLLTSVFVLMSQKKSPPNEVLNGIKISVLKSNLENDLSNLESNLDHFRPDLDLDDLKSNLDF